MANRVLVNEDSLVDIAAAIKEQSGDYETTYTPGEMGNAIRNLPIGEGGGGGQNIYVDGFSILQDGTGCIYTAIGGGYINDGGGGEGGDTGPMVIWSAWEMEGKADTDGWVKLSVLEDTAWADMISTNREMAIEIREFHQENGENSYYKEMTLTNWNYDEGWFEFNFNDEWAYSKLKLVGGEAWIYQTQFENVDDYNNLYSLTGFTLYAITERMISSSWLEATCPEDGIISVQMLEEGSMFGFLQPYDAQYQVWVDLQRTNGETETAKLYLNLNYYENDVAEFMVDGDYAEIFGSVLIEPTTIKLNVNDVETFNANYTVSMVHIYRAYSGGRTREGMGPGGGGMRIIPINGAFIPVDNDTIWFDGSVIRANAVQEWRVQEMINEALGGIENGTY